MIAADALTIGEVLAGLLVVIIALLLWRPWRRRG